MTGGHSSTTTQDSDSATATKCQFATLTQQPDFSTNSYMYKKIYVQVIQRSVQIGRSWKPCKCSPVGNKLRGVWYTVLTQKHYAAMTKNEGALAILVWDRLGPVAQVVGVLCS